MEYDDYYHPTEENDTEDSSVQKTTMMKNIKSLDNKYRTYQKTIKVPNKNGYLVNKRIIIEYYISGPSGSYIRNAQTGHVTKDVVGSSAEDTYFKITLTDGKTSTLFYDSPEQYERHHYEEISTSTKEKWLTKKLLYERSKK